MPCADRDAGCGKNNPRNRFENGRGLAGLDKKFSFAQNKPVLYAPREIGSFAGGDERIEAA